MAFTHEHAARQADPDQFTRFVREHIDWCPQGVDFVYGIVGPSERILQSIRFDATFWSVSDAQIWLADKNFKTEIEPAARDGRGDADGRTIVYESGACARFDSDDVPRPEKRERRYDTAELAPPVETPFGFLRAQGVLTKAGVFKYARKDGSIGGELRPPDEVFNARAVASFDLVPITVEHPPAMLTPDTVRGYQVGTVGAPRVEGREVRADALVTAREGLDAIKGGKRWLSSGYDAYIVPRSGVYTHEDGTQERFDAIQVGIEGNHVALTATPRIPGAELRTDSAPLDGTRARGEGSRMAKVKIGETEIEVPDESAAVIQTHVAAVQADRDKAQGRADALDAELKKTSETTEKQERTDAEAQAIEARAELVAQAAPILEKKISEVSRMDSKSIMTEVLKVADPNFDPAGKSDDYIRSRFDFVLERRVDSADQIRTAGAGAVFQPRTDGGATDWAKKNAEAREKMIEEQNNRWKPKAS